MTDERSLCERELNFGNVMYEKCKVQDFDKSCCDNVLRSLKCSLRAASQGKTAQHAP